MDFALFLKWDCIRYLSKVSTLGLGGVGPVCLFMEKTAQCYCIETDWQINTITPCHLVDFRRKQPKKTHQWLLKCTKVDKISSSSLYFSRPDWHHLWLIFFFWQVPHTTPLLKYQNSPSGNNRQCKKSSLYLGTVLDWSELSKIWKKKPKTLEKTRKSDYRFHLEISEPWAGRVKDVMLQLHCDEPITDAGNG